MQNISRSKQFYPRMFYSEILKGLWPYLEWHVPVFFRSRKSGFWSGNISSKFAVIIILLVRLKLILWCRDVLHLICGGSHCLYPVDPVSPTPRLRPVQDRATEVVGECRCACAAPFACGADGWGCVHTSLCASSGCMYLPLVQLEVHMCAAHRLHGTIPSGPPPGVCKARKVGDRWCWLHIFIGIDLLRFYCYFIILVF